MSYQKLQVHHQKLYRSSFDENDKLTDLIINFINVSTSVFSFKTSGRFSDSVLNQDVSKPHQQLNI